MFGNKLKNGKDIIFKFCISGLYDGLKFKLEKDLINGK